MTTLNQLKQAHQPHQPSASVRKTEGDRKAIAAHVQAFLRSGGRIQQVENGISGSDYRLETHNGKLRYRRNSFSSICINPSKPDPRGTVQ